jgi:hypothetical protein
MPKKVIVSPKRKLKLHISLKIQLMCNKQSNEISLSTNSTTIVYQEKYHISRLFHFRQ